jgi:hypothetical protein
MDAQHLTALEFLEAERKASQNSTDKPAFKRLLQELGEFPKAQQRLAFEFLAMAWRSVKHKKDPSALIAWATFYGRSVEGPKSSGYTYWLERIIFRSFDLMTETDNTPNGTGPFTLTLVLGIGAMRRMDQARSRLVLDALKRACGEADPRAKVIARIERMAPRNRRDGADGHAE